MTPTHPAPQTESRPVNPTDRTSNNQATYPTLFRLSDQLILQIPPQHLGTRSSGPGMTPPSPPVDKLPQLAFVGFAMFLPDFGGYTPENWGVFDAGINKIHIQQVRIVEKEKVELFSKDRVLRYIDTSIRGKQLSPIPENKFGLRCYRWSKSEDVECFGEPEKDELVKIFMLSTGPGKTRLVGYSFKKRYGGVQVQWSADSSQLPHWLEIDQHIWKCIDAWNIAPSTESATTSLPKTHSGKQ